MVQMEWSETPWGSGKMMIEQAKEELQILEAQHPNRFEYLKLELKSFITLLQSQNPFLLSNQYNSSSSVVSSSSTATTQASSTSKKRKKGSSEMLRPESGGKIDQNKRRIQRANCDDSLNGRRRDRVEVVIERAQACLHKIQQFKTSF
ncbi:hypothetical protein Vadar_033173 [Vaccinium darrowii]|uniref:Uncharacterized protein n=1 Tax=Vaccinium darrowii TaxID=229202 RepID=A0ACB7YBL0_9ERIC|nr:hypothetical protein Vadar_033173 [Vaccinium darrowii]